MGCYVLTQIHAQYPNARLGIVVSTRADMIRSLLNAYPWIEVHEVTRFNFSALWRLWSRFAQSDLVLTQYAGKAGGKFSLLSKFAARLLARRGGLFGFQDASLVNKFLYSGVIPFDLNAAPAQMEREALACMGVPLTNQYPTLPVTTDSSVLARFGLLARKYLLVHLFSGSDKRGLSSERRQALVAELTRKFPNIPLVLGGAASEREAALSTVKGATAVVVAGQTSVKDMSVLVQHSSCVVSVDTGVAHIAAQSGVQLIVLSTCLGRQWWLPEQYGETRNIQVFTETKACQPHVLRAYPPCINNVDFSAVAAACAEYVGSIQ